MAITCTPVIDIKQILGPIMMAQVVKGEEPDISGVLDIMVSQELVQNLLSNIELPSDFADLADVICLQLQMEQVKGVTQALKGGQYEFDVSKVIDLIVNLQLMSSLTQTLSA